MGGRWVIVVLVGIAASGCLSTLALQPVGLLKPGDFSVAVDVLARTSDGGGLLPSASPALAIGVGTKPGQDAFARLSAGGVTAGIRQSLTPLEADGTAAIVQVGGGALAVPDFVWAKLFVGGRIGVPFGAGGVLDNSHLILDLRVEAQGASFAMCSGPCAGAALVGAFGTGVALRLVPGAWIVIEGALHRPLAETLPGAWQSTMPLFNGTEASLAIDGGVSVRFDSTFDPFAR